MKTYNQPNARIVNRILNRRQRAFIQSWIFVAALFLVLLPGRADIGNVGPWGDQGDGSYKNPILPSDYSDPDPIRVGEDYYMVSSTFQFAPGVVILHSKDLVNWRTLGYAVEDVSKLGPKFNWDQMNNYKMGVYAPSIRHHDGKFYIYINCYAGEGLFVAKSEKPEGPYTVTQLRDKNDKPMRTSRWSDICPFWDDDGKAYLAAAGQSALWLFQMSPDGTQLLDADMDVKEGLGGTKFWSYGGTEGNKLYKWNDLYYLFNVDFQGKGPLGKGAYMKRSKHLYGTKADGTAGGPGDPGEYEYILQNDEKIPTQGGFVDTPDGRWYYIAQYNGMDVAGRHPYLLPVTWVNGWPRPGTNVDPSGGKQGTMVWAARKPIQDHSIVFPQGNDEFNAAQLNPQWQWNYQPRADFWSLTENPGHLRLKAFKPIEPGKFFKAGNTILQRYFKSDTVRAEVKMDVSKMADGQEAGFAHFNGGANYFTIGVVQDGGTRKLKFNLNGAVTEGPAVAVPVLYFRTDVNVKNIASFFYSVDGKTFTPFGETFQLVQSGYRGDCIGIYTYNDKKEEGLIDVDWFHYEFKSGSQP